MDSTRFDFNDNDELQIDLAYRPTQDSVELLVFGAVDAALAHSFEAAVDGALRSGHRVTIRLDGVTLFGSGASRIIGAAVERGRQLGRPIVVDGVPPHVQRVLDAISIDEPEIRRHNPPEPQLSPVTFNAVLGRAAVVGRDGLTITTHDVDDPRIIFTNPAFSDISGYRAQDLIGVNPRILQGPLTDRSTIDRLKTSLREQGEFTGEAVNYRADGTPFWMNWRITEIEFGARRYFLALQRDTTLLHRLQRFETAVQWLQTATPGTSGADLAGHIARAADILIEDPSASVSVTFVGEGGEVTARSGQCRTPISELGGRDRRSEWFDASAAMVHVPFIPAPQLTGHLVIENLHPDRLRLIDSRQFEQLVTRRWS